MIDTKDTKERRFKAGFEYEEPTPPVAPAPPVALQTCADCRYASTHRRPRIMEATGFGDLLQFADADETVYTCRALGVSEHGGKEIGLVPIVCSTWATTPKAGLARMSELDRKIAEFEKRVAKASHQDGDE